MTDFLLQMSAQVTLENLRLQDLTRVDGRRPFHDIPDLDPRPFVLATRPFKESQPGQLWDVAKVRAVPCPQRDHLTVELGKLLADYAKLYICAIDRQLFNERYQVMKALETLLTFLMRQGAPRRHKKMWCQLDELAEGRCRKPKRPNTLGIKQLAEKAYPRGTRKPSEVKLERESRDWWQHQQQRLTVPLYDVLQRYGPAPEDFPRDSIYHSMAAILEDLGLESDTYEDLPTALRKRHNKALELT